MRQNEKGRSVFTRQNLEKGKMICNYVREACCFKELQKRKKEYMLQGAGNYILEFKFNEKWWGVDATEEDGSMGCLINYSKNFKNIKPVLKVEQGKPIIKFILLRQIAKDEELLYDYSDWSQVSKNFFPWLMN